MLLRRILAAVGLLACFGLWLVSSATAQSVRIDIPERRRPPPSTRVDLTDLVGGLFALQDGYDRSRQGFVCALAYEDANANGRRDRGEMGMPGWNFTITTAAGATVANGVTDGKGRFCNERPLAPGAYSVRQSIGGDWINTEPGAPTPNVKPVTLRPDSSITVLFGDCRGARCGRGRQDETGAQTGGETRAGPGDPTPQSAGQLCVGKFRDINGDGTNWGEPMLAGWTFEATGPSGTFSLTTAANGVICTPINLLPGTYTVTETMQAGWSSTMPGGVNPQRSKVVNAGPSSGTLLFGNVHALPGQICVNKYQDLDRDAKRDANEPSLAGFTFEVFNPSGVVIASGVTDAEGRWCTATGLPPGGYSVVEIPKPGWVVVDPAGPPFHSPPHDKMIILAPGRGSEALFGNIRSGQVCVTKYKDVNGNGQRNAGEPLLAGWDFRFELMTVGGGTPVHVITDASGRGCADMPTSIQLRITEMPQPGWTATDPVPAPVWYSTTPYAYRTTTLAEGQTVELIFGNRQQTGRVCVVKFHDVDGDGVRDASEPLLSGWTFTAQGAATSPSGVTDKDGVICWDLPVGAYSVVETLQAGWDSTSPGGAMPTRAVTVTDGLKLELEFGNRQTPKPGDICVTKYHDVDVNGAYGAGDVRLAGWTFTLSNGMTAVTNADGRACFTVPEGNYTVTETMQAGWISSDPGGANPSKLVTVIAGETAKPFFGNRSTLPPAKGKVCIVKYNDLQGDGIQGLGDPPLVGWTFNLKSLAGATVGQITTVADPAANCRDLSPGQYVAEEVTQTGWTNTDPSGPSPQKPFQVTSGMTMTLGFGNRQNPPAPNLTVTKLVDVDCGTAQGIANPCVFRIRITNGGPGAYAGPVTFSDSVGFAGNIVINGSTVVTAPLPPGWSCNASGPPNICTGNVNLGPNQSVDVVLTMNLTHVVMPKENCVRLTAPVATGPACVSF
jgi:hypothetical protein